MDLVGMLSFSLDQIWDIRDLIFDSWEWGKG